MPATVEPCEHDGVQTVCLTVVSGFTGNERGSDDLAMEAVISENTLEDEAGTGGFVASPHGGFLGEMTEQASYLHQIARELDDFGLFTIAFENGRCDGIRVHVETDPRIL
jgi:hypothetical protein